MMEAARRWRAIVPAAVALVATGVGVTLTAGVSTRAGVLVAGIGATLALVLVGVLRTRQPDSPETEEREMSGHLGYPRACADPGRRRLLARGALGTALAGGAAVVATLWRATQRAEESLGATSWQPGVRLVDDRGQLIAVDDLEPGAFTTVWPEGHRDEGEAQAVLIRLNADRTVTGPGRPDWLSGGHVAYSKLCTHMGCPVGLYQSRTDLLVCPCHQATFDVLRGAAPVHGPAHRPLPQLPLATDADGYLMASGDFPEPVGPGYWSRPS